MQLSRTLLLPALIASAVGMVRASCACVPASCIARVLAHG